MSWNYFLDFLTNSVKTILFYKLKINKLSTYIVIKKYVFL